MGSGQFEKYNFYLKISKFWNINFPLWYSKVTMLDRSRKKKRPRDLNALAADIVNEAIQAEKPSTEPRPVKNQAAVELGRRGGLKGGKARAEKLTPEQRREIAKKAAEARWKG